MMVKMEREKVMVITCKTCGNEYGRWRSQCPGCGTATPEAVRVKEERETRKASRPRSSSKPQCILCLSTRRQKRMVRCPSCNEPIHKKCLKFHEESCKLFQVQVKAEYKKLGMKEGA